MEEKDSDNVILTMRHSRKAFLLEYLCSLFLISLLLIAFFKKIELPAPFSMSILGMGLAGIAGTELRRFFGDRYKIMPTKLLIIKGVLKVKKRNIYYRPLGFIPDFNLKQSAIQRLLDYGTVHLHAGTNYLELRDIDNPNEVLKMLEKLIEESKKVTPFSM